MDRARIERLEADLALRFTSGNSVPVERAHITAADYNTIRALLRLARAAVDDGEFPAFLTHSQAWPQGYVHGFNDALLLVRQQGFGPRVDDDTLREFKGVVLRADAADTTAGEG